MPTRPVLALLMCLCVLARALCARWEGPEGGRLLARMVSAVASSRAAVPLSVVLASLAVVVAAAVTLVLRLGDLVPRCGRGRKHVAHRERNLFTTGAC